MAGTIIPPGYALAALRWRQSAQPKEFICTFGVELDGSVDPFTIANEIRAGWAAAVPASALPTDYVFVGVSVYVGQDGTPPVNGEAIVNTPGTSATTRPTPNVALLVRKRTALGGRRNRGRMYLPQGYLVEADVGSDGQLATTFRANFQSNLNAFLANLTVPGILAGMVVLHSDAPVAPTAVTSLSLEPKVATQRRRLRP